MRKISFAQAISEATVQLMRENEKIFIMGLGVDDPKGVFNTTLEAAKEFPERVFGMPIAENSMTGIALGAAAAGMRPIVTHQRVDFMPMSMDQLVNHLAKWSFLNAGKSSAPVTIRAIIGRGWGQASQHSQSLQAIFAHVPGLQVVMPYTAYDAKGLLVASVRNNQPTIFIEHRWLHREESEVPEAIYEVPIGRAKILKNGKDVTIVGVSLMNMEIAKALPELAKLNIDVEWIDLRSISPWDKKMILNSVKKTGHLLIADTDHKSFGIGAEIITTVAEHDPVLLRGPVQRVSLPDLPVPCGQKIEAEYYPDYQDIIRATLDIMGLVTETRKKNVKLEEVKKFEGSF